MTTTWAIIIAISLTVNIFAIVDKIERGPNK